MLEPGLLGPVLGGGHDGVHRPTVDVLPDDVGMTGVAGEFLDEVDEDPADLPSRPFSKNGTSFGTGTS